MASALLLASCASYRTPGGPAALADAREAGAGLAPSARFPARLTLVRVQAPDYRSFSVRGLGRGRFTVLPADAVPGTGWLDRISAWPSVAAATALDLTLLPEKISSIEDLRMAAAKDQGDVLLAFTVETVFQLAGQPLRPDSDVSLRRAPAPGARVLSTVSAVFVDVRTGFPYGSLQASATSGDLAAHWGSAAEIDRERLATEQQAFAALLPQAQKTWADIAQ